MNILIIGGTGVLSSAVTAEAMKNGVAVTMINRGKRPIPKGVEHIKADKSNYRYIENVLSGRTFDAVMDYLLLSEEDTRKSVEFYSRYAKQYFFISSCAVYDTSCLNGKESNEDSAKGLQMWPYSLQKWACEKVVMGFFDGKESYYTIIRPCITYDNTRIPYGISPMYGYHWTLVARILAGKPILTWNGGTNRCNMTRVEDFAVGVVGLIGNPKAYNEAFNVCGSETPSFNEVLDVVEDYLHKKIIRIDIDSDFYAKELPLRAGEIRGGRSIDSLNSNMKLCTAVPTFWPIIDIKKGIEITLKYYEQNNYEKGIDWKFDAETDRILLKWCKRKGIRTKSWKIGFVDYLGTAKLSDKWLYYTERYKDNLMFSFINISNRVLKKVLKKVKVK